ncbi:MAG: hypothetical protein ABSA78_18000 [Candidatus Sulfotelmatobacter sp.]
MTAKSRPATGLDRDYVPALAAADRFLQAWQSGDTESGMVLLSAHAKEMATSDAVEEFFSNLGPLAYEIDRGRLVKRGRYEFPIVLVSVSSTNAQLHRRFTSIVMVDTGHSEWVVDKLP